MLSIFKKKDVQSSQSHIDRLTKKVTNTTKNFNKRIDSIEKYAQSIFTSQNKKIEKMKRMCHAMDVLISDKNKDLKMVLANEAQCRIMYGLPDLCTDIIEGRLESDIINDYIEMTGNWNSFVECSSFSIDEIVKECLEEKEFIQIGYINNEKIILKTNIKPHMKEDLFDGVINISNVIDESDFEKLHVRSKLLYDKNDYKVFEL